MATSNAIANFAAQSTNSLHAESATSAVLNDRRRSWLWWFLAVVAVSQLYFVRELVGAYALFVLAFAAIAAIVVTLYMLYQVGELAFARLAALRNPALSVSPVVPHDARKPA